MVPTTTMWRGLALACAIMGAVSHGASAQDGSDGVTVTVDPVTRYFRVTYLVPGNAPDIVTVHCAWSQPDAEDWRPAKVMPLISETALRLLPDEEWEQWAEHGRIIERRAAGLRRTVLFNPYPGALQDGQVDVDFRIEVLSADDNTLTTQQIRLRADNSDVVYIEDWSNVFQHHAIASDNEPEGRQWSWRRHLSPGKCS